MKLFENLSENSLWVKDVMRTLSYTYWTNVILKNYHFLTSFFTLFRQNFFRFLKFFWNFWWKCWSRSALTTIFSFDLFWISREIWTKPSILLIIFDPRKCLHLPHIVHMTYFWAVINLGQNSNPKSLFFTFMPCKLMRLSKSFQSFSSLLQFLTNELSQMNNRIVISVEWGRHERYLWRHICLWWRHIPLQYCPRCIQCEYTKSEAKVVEKWDFQLLRVDDVMRSLDGAHV